MPTVPIRDIVTYYEEAGAGEPLILIMGFTGDLQAWAFQVPELSKHFRVITFDNRGAGRTSAPDRPYSIAGMAEDTAALMDALGVAKAHVLGFSMGGYIAQSLALAHPDMIDRLILLSTAPYIDGFGRAVVRSWMDVRQSNLSREEFVRFTAPWLYSPELLDDEERLQRSVMNAVRNPYAQQDHAFLRQGQAILDWDIRGRHSEIKHEKLVVCGKDDILVPPRNSERLVSLLPKATSKVLSGAHVGVIEYANEYNNTFLEFLASKVAAGA
jgi:pimeloyl-ACP methyl ester carboxylesterase